MESSITFTATGDSFITRRLPSTDDSFREVSSLIQAAQVRFTNLEVTTHEFEGVPSAVSGGTWAIASPHVLKDLKAYGFNLIAWANNHTMDYSYGGLAATEKYLNEYEWVHAGVGANLAKACEPKYLETPSGRVALIAATSTFHDSWMAGEQRGDIIGRPGVNPLRFRTTYQVSRDKLQQLKEIARTSYINAERDLAVKEGFSTKTEPDVVMFGQFRFKEGHPEGPTTVPHEEDMRRILSAVSTAKRQADYVIVSIHAHEMVGDTKDEPAEFLRTFARKCIDEGAHSVIGHGPHIVRGIEVYKNRPIFYSLGNFIFQNDTVTHLPADFYTKYSLNHTHSVADALDARSENDTKGLGADPKVWSSVVPYWRMQDGELKELTLYPIELGYGQPRYKRGWPRLSNSDECLRHIKELSVPFGTTMDIQECVGRVDLT